MKVTSSALQSTIIFSLLILIGNVPISLCLLQDIPTVVPAKPFDDKIKNICATVLQDALKKGNKGHKLIIQIITSITLSQRQELRTTYQQKYKKDLLKEIESTFSGDAEDMIFDLFKPPEGVLANYLYGSMKGIGTKEIDLITGLVLTVRSADERQKVETAFHDRNVQKELLDMVAGDTSGTFKTVLIKILQCNLPSDTKKVDTDSAKKDAAILNKASGNDIENAVNILFTSPPNQLRETLKQLTVLCKTDADVCLSNKYGGNVGVLFGQRASIVMNEAKYAAERFQYAVKGAGTNEKMIRVLTVILSEKNLGDVISIYNELYKNSIQKRMAEDIKGDFLDIVNAICGSKRNGKK